MGPDPNEIYEKLININKNNIETESGGCPLADHTCLIVAMRDIRAYVEKNNLDEALGPVDMACAAVARVVEGQSSLSDSEVDNLTASKLIVALLEHDHQVHYFPYPRRLSGRRKKAV